MRDDPLIRATTKLATQIRMGNGIDIGALEQLRVELDAARAIWRDLGVVSRGQVGVLLELYPALLGSLGHYSEEEAMKISNLAETLLDEMLIALDE